MKIIVCDSDEVEKFGKRISMFQKEGYKPRYETFRVTEGLNGEEHDGKTLTTSNFFIIMEKNEWS